jgi:hypothetical protein
MVRVEICFLALMSYTHAAVVCRSPVMSYLGAACFSAAELSALSLSYIYMYTNKTSPTHKQVSLIQLSKPPFFNSATLQVEDVQRKLTRLRTGLRFHSLENKKQRNLFNWLARDNVARDGEI